MIIVGLVAGAFGGMLDRDFKITDSIFYPSPVGIEGIDTATVDSIVDECRPNKRIDKRLECVNEHVSRFYHYVVRDDDEVINFTVLMQEGGDCGNWAKFWEYVGAQYDYDIEPVRIDVEKGVVAHRFSILSNQQGYCNVDQTNVDCFIYG